MINTTVSLKDKKDYIDMIVSVRDTNSDYKHDIKLKLYPEQVMNIADTLTNFLDNLTVNNYFNDEAT